MELETRVEETESSLRARKMQLQTLEEELQSSTNECERLRRRADEEKKLA